jgi:hypothetical protein
MPDATPTLGPKPYVSLFTRLAAVEVELHGLTRLVAGLKADHDAMRKDRDEWRWRAERLLADQERGFWGRMSNRFKAAFGRVIAHIFGHLSEPRSRQSRELSGAVHSGLRD